MLLGVVLHACLAYMGPYWHVHDRGESGVLIALFAFIHGWRMELFFLLAGYFSAQVLRQAGPVGMLQRRLRRLVLPFLLGVCLVLPVAHWLITTAQAHRDDKKVGAVVLAEGVPSLVRRGDLVALQKVATDDPELGNAQYLAAALGKTAELTILLNKNEGRLAETLLARLHGETALHAAARFGQAESLRVILAAARGQAWEKEILEAKNDSGLTPRAVAEDDLAETLKLHRLLGVVRPEADIVRAQLALRGQLAPGASPDPFFARLQAWLYFPLFHHLWFMWVLIIHTLFFGFWAWVQSRYDLPVMPRWMLAEWTRLLWLIPVTAGLLWWATERRGFGAAGNYALAEKPASIIFYGLFFAFGAALRWRGVEPTRQPWLAWVQLIVLNVVVLPLAFLSAWTPQYPVLYGLSCFLQAVLAWGMCFTLLDLFQAYLARPIAMVRYLAHASLWVYLAHFPVVLALQMWMANWPVWPVVKCGLVCTLTLGSLLAVNHWLVRRTWLGQVINGQRA